MIRLMSIQLQWFHTLALLATSPQQRMCTRDKKINDKNHELNFVITSFWRVCPKPLGKKSPKMQVHNSIIDLSYLQIASFLLG